MNHWIVPYKKFEQVSEQNESIVMTRITLFISICLSTAVLVSTFASAGYWIPLLLSTIIGTVWFVDVWKHKGRLSFFCFIGNCILSVAQVIYGLSTIPLIFAVVFSITAFDLSRFHFRICRADDYKSIRTIEITHLKRLALSNVIGCVLALTAYYTHLHSGFYVLIVFGIAIFIIICKLLKRVTVFK